MKIKTILLVLISVTCSYATLSTTYAPAQYNCDGSTTEFTFGYPFFETSDLEVYLVTSATGETNKLVEGAGAGKYTVYAPNADYSSGARITTGTAYANTYRLVIARNVPYGQQLDINGDFVPAEPLEQELDKLAAQIQQVKDNIGRTITAPVTDPASITLQLPAAEERANQIAYFDSNGSLASIPFINSGVIYGDGATIDISTGNVISVKSKAIDNDKLSVAVSNRIYNIADNAITSSKIAAGAVTLDKLVGYTNAISGTSTTLVTEVAVKNYVDNFNSGSSLATNGYQKLPSGLIMMWGMSTEGAVTFQNGGFPNSLFSVTVSPITAGQYACYITAYDKTGFTFYIGPIDSSSAGFWFAIGY